MSNGKRTRNTTTSDIEFSERVSFNDDTIHAGDSTSRLLSVSVKSAVIKEKPLNAIKYICCNKQFLKLLPIPFLATVAQSIYGVVIPQYFAEWFAQCTQLERDNGTCNGDYELSIRYRSIFGVRFVYILNN